MTLPRIGIITGVRTEEKALAPIFNAENSPLVRLSGALPKRAINGVEALIEAGVDGILSFGTAGALNPGLRPGTIVIGESVLSPDGASYACNPEWVETISNALSIQPMGVYGAEYVMGPDAKAKVFLETRRAAIDMESLHAAKLAREADIPFAILRAIVDPVDFKFPEFVFDSVRPDGSVSLLPIIAGLCIQPWLTGRLLDLNKYNNAAMETLSGATRILGPRCGLGLLTL